MNRSIISTVASFFFYVLVQVLILKNIALFNVAFCFVYVAFLLALPVNTNQLLLMLIGFILGIGIDTFYDSLGVHAFAMVLIAYLRNYWLAAITPQSGYDGNTIPVLETNGIQWFLVYSIPLIFIHHFVLFYLEATTFSKFWNTFLKVFSSTIFTLIIILIIQSIPSNNKRA
jgi:rod shape-determining protein MreD